MPIGALIMRALSMRIAIVTGIAPAKSTSPSPLKVPPPGVRAFRETRRSLLPLPSSTAVELLQPRAIALVLVAPVADRHLAGEDRLSDRTAGRKIDRSATRDVIRAAWDEGIGEAEIDLALGRCGERRRRD